MARFVIFRKPVKSEDIEVLDNLPTDREFVITPRVFEDEQEARRWVENASTSYIIKKE